MYRIIVIGRGLIGSAAGRALAEATDGIAVVGPDEPLDRSSHGGVFGSHYDEGRMTRIVDPDPAWSITAKRSIERYEDLEKRSGVRFFTPAGYLGLGRRQSDYLDRGETTGRDHGASVARLEAADIRARFPFLSIADDAIGLQEFATAGHVSPRAMVRAQTEIARQRGAEIIGDEASTVRTVGGAVEVETADGKVLTAERVLIAAGAFTDACGLLPKALGLRVFARTVVLVRTDESVMNEIEGMPTLGDADTGAYILPPIPYPDGHHYVKIGIGTPEDDRLDTLDGLNHWFKGTGSEANREEFTAYLTGLIPALGHCSHWHSDSCAVAQTPSGLPFIDFAVDDRVAVAVGGNGKGAKSSDDWGWLAAQMVLGRDWDHPVPRERLRLPT